DRPVVIAVAGNEGAGRERIAIIVEGLVGIAGFEATVPAERMSGDRELVGRGDEIGGGGRLRIIGLEDIFGGNLVILIEIVARYGELDVRSRLPVERAAESAGILAAKVIDHA